jgi:hypothetical protein
MLPTMTEEQNSKSSGPLFSEVIAEENYLGNPQTIRSLILTAIGQAFEDLNDAADEGERIVALQKQCRGLATVLIGHDPDFKALHKWNTAGSIDEFLAKWLGIGETDPFERVERAVLAMLGEAIDVAQYAGEDGVLDEQWKPLMEELVSRWTDLFMGIDPPSHAAIEPEEQEIQYVKESAEEE